ncbi:MAG: hypothetical protein HC804_13325 [Anaerolineae bacterium]|nr:hypothetical protein [Anaerolineae bacterium]
MDKSAEIELAQLKTAVKYLIGLLEDGSLIARYDKATRIELAVALNHLLHKVEDLPDTVPDRLVQATAVRSIIEASEGYYAAAQAEWQENLELHMRQAEANASIHGHRLTDWEQVVGSDLEYQASCKSCGGFVYVSHASTYNLLLDTCERVHVDDLE